jgi:hypothetical protein
MGLRFTDEVYTFTIKWAPLHMGKIKAEPLLTLPILELQNLFPCFF